MAILSGRNGRVAYDPTPSGSPSEAQVVAALNAWTASFSTEFEDVSQFGNTNRVYIPGLRDASGTIGGFWDSADRTLFTASIATTPGKLVLMPNITDTTPASGTPHDAPAFYGLAYIDFNIDCSLQAPKVTGNWRAAGDWALQN
jgi:hypothetical protein